MSRSAWVDDDIVDHVRHSHRGLVWQFEQKEYVPASYWLSVVLISIVGTSITDNLVDNFHVPLQVTAIAFAIALATTFLM